MSQCSFSRQHRIVATQSRFGDRVMRGTEGALRDLWHIEKKLLQLLHADSTTTSPKRRFAGLLPPKPVDEKTRQMGRVLLEAMGVKIGKLEGK